MPNPNNPTPAPAAVPAPAATTPAPVSTPAPAAASSVPDVSTPLTAAKPTVSAAKALGLPESPHKTVLDSVSKYRETHKLDALTTPPAAAAPAPEKKETPPAPAPEKKETPPAPTKDKKEEPPAPEAPKDSPEVSDLKKQLKDLNDRVVALTPKPPAPEAPKAPTPEEIARQTEQTKLARASFLEGTSKSVEIQSLTEKELDAILEGGKPALEQFEQIRRRDVAAAVMHARETIYNDLNPLIAKQQEQIAALQPALDEHMNWQRVRVEESFKSQYPHMVPHMELAKATAAALMQQFPNETAALSQEAFFKELERQTRDVAKRLGVTIAEAAAAVAAPGAAAPAIPVVKPAPVTPPAPAAVTPPAAPAPLPAAPKPPAAVPASAVVTGAARTSWAKNVAASLTS